MSLFEDGLGAAIQTAIKAQPDLIDPNREFMVKRAYRAGYEDGTEMVSNNLTDIETSILVQIAKRITQATFTYKATFSNPGARFGEYEPDYNRGVEEAVVNAIVARFNGAIPGGVRVDSNMGHHVIIRFPNVYRMGKHLKSTLPQPA